MLSSIGPGAWWLRVSRRLSVLALAICVAGAGIVMHSGSSRPAGEPRVTRAATTAVHQTTSSGFPWHSNLHKARQGRATEPLKGLLSVPRPAFSRLRFTVFTYPAPAECLYSGATRPQLPLRAPPSFVVVA